MKNCLLLLIVISFMHAEVSFGHGDEKHEEVAKPEFKHESIEGEEEVDVEVNKDTFKKINLAYEKNVKPIFENSCFNCHSQKVNYPWYYKLPIVKSMIDEDIKEARKHLNFDGGFPFKGHGAPVKDLKAIAKEVKGSDMPPLEYIVMHPSSYLNEQEKRTIIKWTEESLELLK